VSWPGAFGDLGTLVPFLVGYVTIARVDPAGILVTFGLCLVGLALGYAIDRNWVRL
jgi:hypothetical protein